MGMGFAPTWLRQVSPLLHKTTLTTSQRRFLRTTADHLDFVGLNLAKTRAPTKKGKIPHSSV